MECLKSSSNLTFAFNIMVHVTILFTILSLFYFTFVSEYQLSNYRDTIQNGLQNVINPLSEKMTPTEKVKAAEFLDFIGTEKLKDYYWDNFRRTYSYKGNNNFWLRSTAFAVSGILFAFTIGFYFFLKFSCGICLPLGHVLVENILTFMCIGPIEVLFFFLVISKYVSVKPSALVDTVVKTAKHELSGKANICFPFDFI